MRAIVVEFAGPVLALPGVIEGQAVRIGPGEPADVSASRRVAPASRGGCPRGEGRLAPRPAEPPADGDNPEGEPR